MRRGRLGVHTSAHRIRVDRDTLPRSGRQRDVDLHPDGQRFAVAVTSEQTMAKTDKVVFVYNFLDEVRCLISD